MVHETPYTVDLESSFLIHPGLDGAPDTLSFELVISPGAWLTAYAPPDEHPDCERWADGQCCTLPSADCPSLGLRLYLRLCSWSPAMVQCITGICTWVS